MDLPIKNGDFPLQNVSLPEGIYMNFSISTGRIQFVENPTLTHSEFGMLYA